jgi:hypothetical protein
MLAQLTASGRRLRSWQKAALFVLTAFVGSGCFMANMSPAKKIGDTVHDLNDQARWGRLTDAALLVDPSYRQQFIKDHQRWGDDIQLADSEVLQVQIATDAEHASALVNYSWYAMDTMTLRQTTVRQRWSAVSGGYALMSEAVVRGDPSLLVGPTNTAAPPMLDPEID